MSDNTPTEILWDYVKVLMALLVPLLTLNNAIGVVSLIYVIMKTWFLWRDRLKHKRKADKWPIHKKHTP